MKIVNLTPHNLTLRTPAGEDILLPPSGEIARVTETPGVPIEGTGLPVPCYGSPVRTGVSGLPAPAAGTAYIVSGLVLAACVDREDVFGPGTGPADGAIRANGQVVAVTRLIAAPRAS
jgi:hypothetical protein